MNVGGLVGYQNGVVLMIHCSLLLAFALDPKGEQVFLYCVGATRLVPLAAISSNGPFSESDLASYGLNESALPTRLAYNGTIELGSCSEWEYAGVKSAEVSELKASMMNTDNWNCNSGSGDPALAVLVRAGVTIAIGLSAWLLL